MVERKHGIRVREADTQLERPLLGHAGLQVVFGTAPINLAKDPRNATNKLILCKDFESAVSALGYSEDFKKYTLCQAMHASYKLAKVSPVIFVNVLDPAKHKTTITDEVLTVTNKQATLNEEGVILDTLVVKKSGGDTLANNTDYIAAFTDDGKVLITLLSSGAGASESSIKATADKLNPSAVTATDIVGGYDSVSGKESGIELVRRVFPTFGLAPGTLLAPGWSHEAVVAAALQGKCENINGKFKAMCLLDLSTSVAAKYADVEKAKKANGASSPAAIALWPMAKSQGKILALSAVVGAACAKLDIDNGDVPALYPSNKIVAIDSACLADGTEVMLDEVEGNMINAVGVMTVINQVGLRLWGNDTAAYPNVSDPKDRWIGVRRMFNWYSNSFILRFLDSVDDPANAKLVESFIDSENIAGNTLVAEGKLAGAHFEYRKEDNTVSQIMNEGKIVFRERIAPFTPAEYIENILSFDPKMIETALGGGE